MDYMAFFSDRFAKLEKYLSGYRPNYPYSLGRVLEIESLAFSLRNEGLLTERQFDQLDLQAETLRRRHFLHASEASLKVGSPYNGRFLYPESSFKEGHE